MTSSGTTAGYRRARWLLALLTLVAIPTLAIARTGGHQALADKLRYGPGIQNHPVHVIPSSAIQVPKEWPLDPDGSITCSTCHQQLPSLDGFGGPHLRDDGITGDTGVFCVRCHGKAGMSGAKGLHWRAVPLAHIKPDKELRAFSASNSLDAESRRCLSCHDGVSASQVDHRTSRGGDKYSGSSSSNHPVGVYYSGNKMRGRGGALRPSGMVPAKVRLPEGKVSCVSCHNLYAQDAHRLTVPIQGSALCFTCHDMD